MAEILPSLLAADFAKLGDDIARVEQAGVGMLHFDVMDGHFVPNISFGVPVLKSVRRVTKSLLDVHLMITDPDRYIGAFADAGADLISVHQEVCPHLDRTLREIQRHKVRAGVVLNPATPVATLSEVLDVADFVLLMSVNPGFGGQKFLPHVLGKARQLDALRRARGLALPIEIDGGVGPENVAECAAAGVNWMVAGSSVFGAADPAAAVREMQRLARSEPQARA